MLDNIRHVAVKRKSINKNIPSRSYQSRFSLHMTILGIVFKNMNVLTKSYFWENILYYR